MHRLCNDDLENLYIQLVLYSPQNLQKLKASSDRLFLSFIWYHLTSLIMFYVLSQNTITVLTGSVRIKIHLVTLK